MNHYTKSKALPRLLVVLPALLSLTLLATLPQQARADVIYSNFGIGDSYDTFASEVVSGFDSVSGTQRDIAVSFTPDQNYQLSSVDLPIFPLSGTNLLTLSIREDAGGEPGTTEVIGDSIGINDSTPFTTWAPEGIVTLNANQTYWLTVLAGAPDGQYDWYLNNTDAQGLDRQINETGWTNSLSDPTPTFRVEGVLTNVVVPESGALPLLLAGLPLVGGMIAVRRYRRAH